MQCVVEPAQNGLITVLPSGGKSKSNLKQILKNSKDAILNDFSHQSLIVHFFCFFLHFFFFSAFLSPFCSLLFKIFVSDPSIKDMVS